MAVVSLVLADSKHMWHKLLRLSASDWLVLAQSTVLLPAINFALRRLRLDVVQARLARWSPLREARPAPIATEARTVARMVDALARRAPFEANCLHRSLTTWFLLRRRGIDSTMRFGVRPDKPPAFHAWIEADATVINDRHDIASIYLPFPTPIGPSQVSSFD